MPIDLALFFNYLNVGLKIEVMWCGIKELMSKNTFDIKVLMQCSILHLELFKALELIWLLEGLIAKAAY